MIKNPAEERDWWLVRPEAEKIIRHSDWVEIAARDVRMGAADVGAVGAHDDAGGFGTDAAISRGRGG